MFQPIPGLHNCTAGLISCARVTGRWGLVSHAQSTQVVGLTQKVGRSTSSACIPPKTQASPPFPPPTHLPHMHIFFILQFPPPHPPHTSHTHTLTQLTGSRGRPEDISIFLPTNCGTILTPATLPPCTNTSSTLVPGVRRAVMSYTRTPSRLPSPSGYLWSITAFFVHSSLPFSFDHSPLLACLTASQSFLLCSLSLPSLYFPLARTQPHSKPKQCH